ncbi:Ferredoxin-dependent glutamate synthase [hydrothermal vent metagenome]|uniref:Ferredoxin-dependent glutamate synthase n=1 Tax=hydrothermal vent metagenome TaxID=652676 RepID=A0A3B0X2T6_9ZZZZ
MSVRQLFIILSVVIPLFIFILNRFWSNAYGLFFVVIPLIGLGIYDMVQTKHTLLRLYPVIGHFRFMFELIRPEIQQYFVESDTDGVPINREFRALVYQRAKGQRDTRPFGTLFDVYREGYEWINHSLAPKQVKNTNPKIRFGGKNCTQPYEASPLNISAMSFGALSQNAIMALNKGAKIGGFSHNTGEGGISSYHLKYGGDLVWQIGTGYFGCRNAEGQFDEALFSEKAKHPVVKMIEIKISQGAKPGHGGILPAVKLTQEIATIRHVPMGHDVVSPPSHSAFSTPIELLDYVAKLRQLSGGKPVGFKLCLGQKSEFLAICKAMLNTGIKPDFITVDGGEGGTGAAPVELTNSVGTPLRDALIFVNNALIGCGLRDEIRIIASGKAMSAFHIIRLLALGADTVNSARAMLFSLGCIQSRHCNQDTCPTGIATQNPARYKALDVNDKGQRVANYQFSMIENLMELLAAAGLECLEDLKPWHINRRINGTEITNYKDLYPCITKNCLLSEDTIPCSWEKHWQYATANYW